MTQPIDILLVEDNPGDVLLFRESLAGTGLPSKLHVVQDGELALDFLMKRGRYSEAATPEAVFLDLNLPRRSGLSVLAEMQKDPELRTMPVFVFTTSTDEHDMHRALALGAKRFLNKPAELTEFERIVHDIASYELPRVLNRHGTAQRVNGTSHAAGPKPGAVNETLFRLLVEATRDYAIFMLDPNGHVMTWNRGAERINGYTAREIVGRHFSVFYPPEKISAGHPQHELRIAGAEGRFEEDGWRLRKDGSRFWASVTLTAVRDADGALLGFAKVTRDITERKRAEERLRQSEENFRLLVEGVRDYAIIRLDPEGIISSWNQGAERITGFPAHEAVGNHFRMLCPPATSAEKKPEEELRIAREHGSYKEVGLRLRRDGSTYWASVVVTPVYDEAGTFRGFSKVTRDITEQRRAEEQIMKLTRALESRVEERTLELERQIHRLERSNGELEQYAYITSHDLQEPLRTIISYLQYLERKAGSSLDEDSRKYLRLVVDGARRMRDLIADLLSYSRVGRDAVETQRISLDGPLAAALSNLADAVRASGAEISSEPLPTVQCEFSEMTQLFQNLISNAIKFRHPDVAPNVEITARQEGAEWHFSVADNGIGIPKEHHEVIFRLFQRVTLDRTKYEGTGVGLAICKKIVESRGGRIWVESEPGQGATFRFTLPAGGPS